MSKKILSMLLVVVMVCALFVTPALADEAGIVAINDDSAVTFPDTVGNWAESSIDRWSAANVVKGDHAGNFNPDNTITRAELAQVLVNLLGLTEKAEAGAFTDVKAGDWFEDAVLKCAAAGIMKGDGTGLANPGSPITRQEAIVMIGRALGVQPVADPELKQFQDGETVADWAAPYLAPLTAMGILNGVADEGGNVNVLPLVNIDRASTMALLDKAIGQYVVNGGSVKADDADKFVVVKAPEGEDVVITGETAGVTVAAGNAAGVKLDNVAADSVKVDAPVSLIVDQGSKVDALTLNAPAKVRNNGTVNTVANNAANTVFDGKAPGKIENAEGVGALKDSNGNEVKKGGVIVVPSGGGSSSGGPVVNVKPLEGATVILHSNDVHGAVEGYAKMAQLKYDYEAKGAEVLVMDAGDFSQGTTYVSVSQGATAVELMNLVGYDVATTGNHEFDYGAANLDTLAAAAEFELVAGNIIKDGTSAYTKSTVIELQSGKKLGVFGLATPETATKAHPAKIQGLSFLAEQDLYAYAQTEVDALKAAGADYIVCLSHLGIDPESEPNRSIDLLDPEKGNVTGIDVLIDGHSHSGLDEIVAVTNAERTVNGAQVTSTGTKFANIGVVTIDKNGAITTANVAADTITVSDSIPAVKAVSDKAAAIIAEIDAAYDQKFATSTVELNGAKAPGNRTQETNLGDLIADAMLWQATKDGALEGVDAKNVIALTNGGGIRASIAAGDVTKKDVNTVLPFGNTVAVAYVKGSVLLECLEASTAVTPEAMGGFPQVAGIEFTVDTTKTFETTEKYPGTTVDKPAAINRVTITSVNGEAFNADADYAVVTNDFVAARGDSYYALSVSEKITDTGVPLDEALMDYITTVLNGEIGESYAQPKGRITVVTAASEEPAASETTFAAMDATLYSTITWEGVPTLANMQENVTFTPDAETPTTIKVKGNIKYVTGFTGFNAANAQEQQGNYVALMFEVPAEALTAGKVTLVKGHEGATDKVFDLSAAGAVDTVGDKKVFGTLQRVSGTDAVVKYTVDWDGEGDEYAATTYTLDFSEATLVQPVLAGHVNASVTGVAGKLGITANVAGDNVLTITIPADVKSKFDALTTEEKGQLNHEDRLYIRVNSDVPDGVDGTYKFKGSTDNGVTWRAELPVTKTDLNSKGIDVTVDAEGKVLTIGQWFGFATVDNASGDNFALITPAKSWDVIYCWTSANGVAQYTTLTVEFVHAEA